MSKRDKEIQIDIRDTEVGVELMIGSKRIGEIQEKDGKFEAYAKGDRKLGIFKSYLDAEEEVIKAHHLMS